MSNIPGSLGYHPRNCLMIFFFDSQEENSFSLGPLLRVDFENIRPGSEVYEALRNYEPDLLFAVVIGGAEHAHYGRRFAAECAVSDLPLAAVWHVQHLLTGEPYTRIAGQSVANLGLYTSGREQWEHGVVADIATAPAMSAMLAAGDLPELSRADAYAFFTATECEFTAGELNMLASSARQHAQSWIRALENSDPADATLMVEALLEDFEHVLSQVDQRGLNAEKVLANEEMLETLLPYFAHTKLRDCIFTWSTSQYARALFNVCLAIARGSAGQVRANALCVVALTAAELDMPYRVSPALQLAQQAHPEHRLTALMLRAVQLGTIDVLSDACREGSAIAVAALSRGNRAEN